MVALAVVMLDELVHRCPEMPFPQRNHTIQTLVMSQIWAERIRPAGARWSRRSLVVIQQATEPRTPTNPAGASPRRVPIDKPILEPLVISLAMVVIDEFLECPSNVALAERHHSIEALVFDRPYKPFGIGVRIGRLTRRLHDGPPALPSSRRTSRLHFRSRSQISTRWSLSRPSVPVSVPPTWRMKRS